MTATADLLDVHGDDAAVCLLPFRSFGARSAFAGPIATIRCDEDNVLVKQRAGQPGEGRVLVVDGGGSRRVALVGDVVAGLARENGWAGIVVNGCVRDVAALRLLDIGVVALGSNPRPSGKKGAGELDVTVAFGDASFAPGDRLHADEDGVVVLPHG